MAADDLISPLRAVCVLDPALDRAAMRVNEYAETRDPNLVRELPGQRARWVTLDPLSVNDFLLADGYPTGPLKMRSAFIQAVRCIEHFDADTPRLNPSRMLRDEEGRDRAVWSGDEFTMISRALGVAFVYEMGKLAYDRATAGNFWGGSVSYTLPQSSEVGLEQIARLLAARARAIVGIQSNDRSAAP